MQSSGGSSVNKQINRVKSKVKLKINISKVKFKTNLKCRLINPAKSEIGKKSKIHLDSIDQAIRQSTKLNQWRSTGSAITWFKNFDN